MSRPAALARPISLMLSFAFALAVLVSGGTSAFAQNPEHPMAAKGKAPEHGSLSAFPWEAIDGYTGNVSLRFDDVVMVGPAGFNVAITRTYNSKDGGWSWGVGPSMVMPDGLPGGYYPRIHQADGAEVRLFLISEGVYISPSFDRYTVSSRTLEMASGIKAHFDARGQLTDMVDPFGNVVEVTINSSYQLTLVKQYLGNGQIREAVLDYVEGTNLLSKITCQGREWNYTWETQAGTVRLTHVTPPVGPGWSFDYDLQSLTNPQRLEHTLTVTLPTEAKVQYLSWEPRWSVANELHVLNWPSGIPKLYQRRISAAGNIAEPDDTWTFQYTENGRTTSVTGSTAVTVGPNGQQQPFNAYFLHYPGGDPGWGTTGYNPDVAFPTALLGGSSGTGMDATEVLWQPGQDLGTAEIHAPANEADTDPRTFFPTQVKRLREGRYYTTTYTYDTNTVHHQHFGQPLTVTETGDFTRTTTYEYTSFTGATYLADRVSKETITDGTRSYESSFVYDATTGFLRQKTALGLETNFWPDAMGNVASQRDAGLHTTAFSYTWGALQNTTTPAYVIERDINPDGSVAAERRQGEAVSYQYDGLGRVTEMQPRVGAPTITSYDNQYGRAVTVSRDVSSTTQTLDAWGRQTRTVTATGVAKDVGYDLWGRRTSEGAPRQGVGATSLNTLTVYDALDRPVKIERPDGSWVKYAYTAESPGWGVTITESVLGDAVHVSHQRWAASGSPSQARLLGVGDANGRWTCYTYDVLGALTAVRGPAPGDNPGSESYAACTARPATRTWEYNTPQHQLWRETHPESGQTTYAYNGEGLLTGSTDAENVVTTRVYDGNHRLAKVTQTHAPDTPRDTVFTYDAWDSRVSADNGGVQTSFTYDGGRLVGRADLTRFSTQLFETRLIYDERDNLVELDYPSGQAVRYEYDADNRITKVRDAASATVYANAISYHPSGGLAQYTAGNGIIHAVTYEDTTARPSRIQAGPLDLSYTYDHVGNVRTLTDTRSGMNQSFTYDPLDRLWTATGFYGSITYTYDALGNRSGAGTTAEYSPTTLRLTKTTVDSQDTPYGYDNNGSLTSEGGGRHVTYAYTPDRLVETASFGASNPKYTYTYDSDGLRTVAGLGDLTDLNRFYLHGPGGQLLSEFEQSQQEVSWQVAYLYLGSRLLGAVRPTPPPPNKGRVTVAVTGTGSGWVTSSPAGFNCWGTCSQFLALNTEVILTAHPEVDSTFAGWSGSAGCTGNNVELTITVAASVTCRPTFNAIGGVRAVPYDVRSGPYGSASVLMWWAHRVSDQTNFQIQRNPDGAGWEPVATQTAQSFLDPTPPCGALAYRVRAYWAGDNSYSAWSRVTNVRTCIPAAPDGLRALPVGPGWFLVLWEDRSIDETDFWLQRKIGSGVWANFTIPANTVSSWDQDTQAGCGDIFYRVVARRVVAAKDYFSTWTAEVKVTRSCGEPTAAALPTNPSAGPPTSLSGQASLAPSPDPAMRMPAATTRQATATVSWLLFAVLGTMLAGVASVRRRLTLRAATVALLAVVALMLPTQAFAQEGQIVEYYHLDALGSVRVVTGENQQVIARHDFLPFGEEYPGPQPTTNEKKLFTGHERDAETGLDYFGARYYRPQVGRFTTIDPVYTWSENLTDPERWNRYAYARNNPLRWVDPDGRSIWTKLAKAVVKVFKAGNAAAAIADDVANVETVLDPSASASDRLWAAAELASELLPVSIGDVTDVVKWAKRGDHAADSTKGTNALIKANKAAGDRFRDEIAGLLTAEGRTVEREKVLKTPFGPRRIDVHVTMNGTVVGGIETKVGGSRYTPSQRAKDMWLKMQGYVVTIVRGR